MTDGGERQADARFRALVECAPDGIVISRDGIVLYMNPAALRLLGYDAASEIVGRPMSEFLDAEGIATMRRRLMEMRQNGLQPSPYEYEARRRDGTRVTAEITSIFLEHDGAPAVLAFARDVTERVRMRAQLAHADRLAALGMMAGGIAHEINNPLGYLTLATEMLERRLSTSGGHEDDVKLAKEIRSGVERITAIARDLRVYARYEEEPVAAVDLASVVASAARVAAPELRGRAEVTIEIGEVRVSGVATRIEQVFVNLFINAAHAMRDGRDDGAILVRATDDGVRVRVEVSDDGQGMAPEVVSRVFEPFFTTRPGTSGTGLGLSICRDIVERGGGKISATSELGRGTTIRIEFPRAVPKAFAAQRGPSAAPASPVPGTRARVLVIDDEPLIVSTVTRALNGKFDVVGVTSSTTALEHLLTDAGFDVVICDLMMPELTGMDLYAEIARQRPGLEKRFRFVTGGSYTPRAREFLDAVPNARLMKPFTARELVAWLGDRDAK